MKPNLLKFLRTFLPLAVILSIIGWAGIFIIVRATVPTIGPRWLFFFFSVLGLTGLALPVTYGLNKRFPSEPIVEDKVILRQALWVGIYGSTVGWLQLGRVLTGGLALILAVVFVLVEFLLRLFERSHWKPKQEP